MKTTTCGIYKITSISGKIYIGQSIDIEYRWSGYKKYFGEGQPKLYNSLKKYGIENHTFEIIEECIQELLNEREIHWIKHFDTFNTPHGMNLRSGGDQGLMSEETRKRQSEGVKKRPPITEETRKRQSEAQKKRVPFTEEHLKNMSEALKKRPPITEETRMKHREAAKKRAPFSEEDKKNMRKPRSEEGRKNMSKAQMGSIKSEESKNKTSERLKGNTYGSGNKGKKQSPERIAKRIKTTQENRKLKDSHKQDKQ